MDKIREATTPKWIKKFNERNLGADDGTRIASQDSPAGYLRRESIRKKFDQTNPEGFMEMTFSGVTSREDMARALSEMRGERLGSSSKSKKVTPADKGVYRY